TMAKSKKHKKRHRTAPPVSPCVPSCTGRVCGSDGCGGTCGPACTAPAHAHDPVCRDGACRFTCDPGWGDCDHDPSNGCETDLTTELQHCGACDSPCREVTQNCVAGACCYQSGTPNVCTLDNLETVCCPGPEGGRVCSHPPDGGPGTCFAV